MGKKLAVLALAVPFIAGIAGCPQNQLIVSLPGFAPLRNGFHYEGWAIVGGSARSTGKFNLNADGDLIGLDGRRIPGGTFFTPFDLGDATAIVLTIEPAGDVDEIPAATRIARGPVLQGSAVLTVGAALGDPFLDARGRFLLATPTDGPDSNEESGIWFIDNSSGSGMPGLVLPELPAGWKFEGWVGFGGFALTTGTFTATDAADEAAPFSGPLPGPPFPGEDYLTNAPEGLEFPTSLVGRVAVITIEPFPDDSPAPFFLRPLIAEIPPGVMISHDMMNIASEFPVGVAIIR